MKARWIVIPAALAIIISAGHILRTEAIINEAPLARALVLQSITTQQEDTEALVKKGRCLRCHSVDKLVIGPAFQDIAERYKNDAGARDELIKTVRNGGKGHWTELTGGVPMPPHSARLSPDEIASLVDWILSLRDQQPK